MVTLTFVLFIIQFGLQTRKLFELMYSSSDFRDSKTPTLTFSTELPQLSGLFVIKINDIF